MINDAPPLPSVFDTQSLSRLRSDLRRDDPQALKAAARQFESVFLQMVLKSMRATVPQTGIFDSDQTRFYQELLDSQLAQVMSAKGGLGLAAVIERQLAGQNAVADDAESGGLPLLPPQMPFPLGRRSGAFPLNEEQIQPELPLEQSPVRPVLPGTQPLSGSAQAQSFTTAVWPHAQSASRMTGIPARFLVAQAALETGWGRAEIRHADGTPSHNLFGIKAGGSWSGAVVEAATTEYSNGVAERRIERFRAYGSYAESFRDYAQLLSGSPRYAGVLGSSDAAGFARSLQRAGYATDPDYAAKLERVIGSLAQLAAGSPRA